MERRVVRRQQLPEGFNAHHTIFTRKDCKQRGDLFALRSHRILVVPMDVYDHGSYVSADRNEIGLHHNDSDVHPPTRPNGESLRLPSEKFVKIVLDRCEIYKPLPLPRVEAFTRVRNDIHAVGRDLAYDRQERSDAERFADNFSLQLEYMRRRPLEDPAYYFWEPLPEE